MTLFYLIPMIIGLITLFVERKMFNEIILENSMFVPEILWVGIVAITIIPGINVVFAAWGIRVLIVRTFYKD